MLLSKSLLIMSHLREAIPSILFPCCLRRLLARKHKQQVLKHCGKNHPRVQPPFCPQLPLCLLISSTSALLEGLSPPSFWRYKMLEIKISLFCDPGYGKWKPFWFPEWHSGMGRASRSQQHCVEWWLVKWFLLHWSPGGTSTQLWVPQPLVGPQAFKRKKVPS